MGGHAIALEFGFRGGARLQALNMTHVVKPENERIQPSIVWRKQFTRPVKRWALFRRRNDASTTDLIATLSEDGRMIRTFELAMNLEIEDTRESIFLNAYIMLPLIVTVVLLFVGWHYWKYGRHMG